MSTLKDVFAAVKEVLLLTNKVESLGKSLQEAAIELREHDRRLVRLETMVEMAQKKFLSNH
ncbi:MAG: hypothetical protein KJ630_24400 [Proteobacteria bacterium]|nr:hypothetical protein [Pseudomonadota bacterium]